LEGRHSLLNIAEGGRAAIPDLKNKLGDVTMDNELLQEKIERLEARASPSRGRRSK
jgi:hypothetical protein